MTATKQNITLDDGRKGYQATNERGELAEVVITRLANGRRVRQVYATHGELNAYLPHLSVFSFADLGNVEWTLDGE